MIITGKENGHAKKAVIVAAGISDLSAGGYARMNGYDAEIHEVHTLSGEFQRTHRYIQKTVPGLSGFCLASM